MTAPGGSPDPKAVLQAHALRSEATNAALLHGTRRPRTSRRVLGALYGSAVVALIIIIAVVVAEKIASLIH